MKAIVSVYAAPFEADPTQVFEFHGTETEVQQQLADWANGYGTVIFDLEIIEDNQMSAQYGLTLGTER